MIFRICAVVVLLASSLMAQSNAAQPAAAQANGPVFSFHSRGTLADFFSFRNLIRDFWCITVRPTPCQIVYFLGRWSLRGIGVPTLLH